MGGIIGGPIPRKLSRGVPDQPQEDAMMDKARISSFQRTGVQEKGYGLRDVPAMPPCRDRRRDSDTGLDAPEGGGCPSGGLL